MAGSLKVSGTEELAAMLNQLGNQANRIASYALYDGAAVVADAYRDAVEEIQTRPRGNHEPRDEARYPTPEEKAAIVIGVSKFRRDGDWTNTSVGAGEGYTFVKGRKKAIKLIANSINSGTAFMKKQPVFRKALSRAKAAAQNAMVDTAERMIKEITK